MTQNRRPRWKWSYPPTVDRSDFLLNGFARTQEQFGLSLLLRRDTNAEFQALCLLKNQNQLQGKAKIGRYHELESVLIANLVHSRRLDEFLNEGQEVTSIGRKDTAYAEHFMKKPSAWRKPTKRYFAAVRDRRSLVNKMIAHLTLSDYNVRPENVVVGFDHAYLVNYRLLAFLNRSWSDLWPGNLLQQSARSALLNQKLLEGLETVKGPLPKFQTK